MTAGFFFLVSFQRLTDNLNVTIHRLDSFFRKLALPKPMLKKPAADAAKEEL